MIILILNDNNLPGIIKLYIKIQTYPLNMLF